MSSPGHLSAEVQRSGQSADPARDRGAEGARDIRTHRSFCLSFSQVDLVSIPEVCFNRFRGMRVEEEYHDVNIDWARHRCSLQCLNFPAALRDPQDHPAEGAMIFQRLLPLQILGPPARCPFSPLFWLGGFRTLLKSTTQKRNGTLILTSLLENPAYFESSKGNLSSCNLRCFPNVAMVAGVLFPGVVVPFARAANAIKSGRDQRPWRICDEKKSQLPQDANCNHPLQTSLARG